VSAAGAVLIFLPRYTEISETLKALRGAAPSRRAQAAAAVPPFTAYPVMFAD
jgi:hypothetical protein